MLPAASVKLHVVARAAYVISADAISALDNNAISAYDGHMNYPGGKNGSGVYQRLINLIPPHSQYIEAFLGSGPIMRLKRPAIASIGIDADPEALSNFPRGDIHNLMLILTDAVDWLERNPLPEDAFVYLDPPYLMSTRASKQAYYSHEFGEPEQHARLLKIATQLKCMVMISGYYSDQYAEALAGWRTITFKSQTRSGKPATEWVWMNYPEPFALHDYRYLGDGFRQRQDIRRMQKRWLARLQNMKPLERYAMLETIDQWENCAGMEQPMIPDPNGKTADARGAAYMPMGAPNAEYADACRRPSVTLPIAT